MYFSEKMMSELSEAAHRFYKSGMQLSNGGNLSARIPGEELMLVKTTDTSFGQVGRKTMVVTDFEGKVVEGEGKPSKESLLHGFLYKNVPHVQAIMHCHSPWATSWAATGQRLPASTYHSVLKLGGNIPVFDTKSYIVPTDYFPAILACLKENPGIKAFLLAGHGQVALGTSVWDAAFLAELVEETAQIAILSRLMGEKKSCR